MPSVEAPDERTSLREELRTAGLRATSSRLAVLTLLRKAGAPLSHAEVGEQLEKQGWDRVTLYRNLLDLTKAQLARRTDLGDHVWRFEAITEEHLVDDHPHFVCAECGGVQCLDGAELVIKRGSKSPKSVKKGQIEIQVKGVCDRCG